MKLLVCAGGTGGGIYPALATVKAIQQEGQPEDQLLWIGVRGEMEEELVPRAGLQMETIYSSPLAGLPLTTKLQSMVKLAYNVWLARGIMRRFRPDVLLVTGGYMSVPVAVAAWLSRVPTVAFVPDVEPGSALKAIGRLVTKVGATVADTAVYFSPGKTVTTGYPVRAALIEATQLSKEEALSQFDLASTGAASTSSASTSSAGGQDGRQTLFVFGGSRGAQSINRALMAGLPDLLTKGNLQIIHISGQLTWPEVEAFADSLPAEQRRFYRPYPYLHERMGAAFRAADLIVARGGASMLAEGPLFGTPAVLVPYPHAWRTQKINADYLVARNAAVRLNDEELAAQFVPTVLGLMQDKARLADMKGAAQGLNTAVGATKLAQLLRHTSQKDN